MNLMHSICISKIGFKKSLIFIPRSNLTNKKAAVHDDAQRLFGFNPPFGGDCINLVFGKLVPNIQEMCFNPPFGGDCINQMILF